MTSFALRIARYIPKWMQLHVGVCFTLSCAPSLLSLFMCTTAKTMKLNNQHIWLELQHARFNGFAWLWCYKRITFLRSQVMSFIFNFLIVLLTYFVHWTILLRVLERYAFGTLSHMPMRKRWTKYSIETVYDFSKSPNFTSFSINFAFLIEDFVHSIRLFNHFKWPDTAEAVNQQLCGSMAFQGS